jgi:hypothetical protein
MHGGLQTRDVINAKRKGSVTSDIRSYWRVTVSLACVTSAQRQFSENQIEVLDFGCIV